MVDDDDEPISEKDARERWGCLSASGLRAARRAGTIAWVRGPRGSAWYRPSAVRAFITTHLETRTADAPTKLRPTITAAVRPVVLPPELADVPARLAEAAAARIMAPQARPKKGR